MRGIGTTIQRKWVFQQTARNHNLDGGKESLGSLFRIANARSVASSLNPKDTASNKVQHSSQGVRILITNLFCITKRIRAFAAPVGIPVRVIPPDEERMIARSFAAFSALTQQRRIES
jgi:hypothetical protein